MPTPTPAETLRKLHALRSEYSRRRSEHLANLQKHSPGTNAFSSELHLFTKYGKAIGFIRDAAERVYRKLDADLVAERFALRHSHPTPTRSTS